MRIKPFDKIDVMDIIDVKTSLLTRPPEEMNVCVSVNMVDDEKRPDEIVFLQLALNPESKEVYVLGWCFMEDLRSKNGRRIPGEDGGYVLHDPKPFEALVELLKQLYPNESTPKKTT